MTKTDSPYATGTTRRDIERALLAAGKDLGALTEADVAPLSDYHTLGRPATRLLADLAGVSSADRVLDAGTGVGGTARFLADRYGCLVTGVDLTEEYCQTAAWLTELTGLADKITYQQGDVTALPFPDSRFDVVISQHVQMNIADKPALYREAFRVLAPGGRLAIWDVAGTTRDDDFPIMWASVAADSHVVSPDELRAAIESAGFGIEHWTDRTDSLAPPPPGPLGLQVFVPDFATRLANFVAALTDGRLHLIQALATRPT